MPGFTHRDQTSAEEARVVPLFGAGRRLNSDQGKGDADPGILRA
jgi:hypothetical protein